MCREWDTSGLYYKTSMIVIYGRNEIGRYYKTTITMVFTILAEAEAEVICDHKFTIVKFL